MVVFLLTIFAQIIHIFFLYHVGKSNNPSQNLKAAYSSYPSIESHGFTLPSFSTEDSIMIAIDVTCTFLLMWVNFSLHQICIFIWEVFSLLHYCSFQSCISTISCSCLERKERLFVTVLRNNSNNKMEFWNKHRLNIPYKIFTLVTLINYWLLANQL